VDEEDNDVYKEENLLEIIPDPLESEEPREA